jgi:glycosyltransferase involved in cell wall biosynthesis
MQDKIVSIIVPTYNRADLIGETIQSVLDQSYKNWELIIVDDGSDDQTEEVIKKFSNPTISYYKIEHSGNLGKVRNIGMKVAKGEYVAFLDSDDLWLPQKLDCQLALLDQYPNASFVFGHGEQFGLGAIPPPELESLFVGNIYDHQLLEERFVIYPSSFLIKKETLNVIGFINENVSGGDNDFFFRMAWKYDGIFCGERLVRIRKHVQNISNERDLIFSEEHIQVLKRFYEDKMLTKKQFTLLSSRQRYKLGMLCLNKGDAMGAVINFSHNCIIRPLNYKGWIRLVRSLIQLVNFAPIKI